MGSDIYDSSGDPCEFALDRMVSRVRGILDDERDPCVLESVRHRYEDKYQLVEKAMLASLRSLVEILRILGLDKERLWAFVKENEGSTKTLRFCAQQECRSLREVKREVENPHSRRVEGDVNVVEKSFTTVTEYHWRLKLRYRLFVFAGSDPKGKWMDVVQGSLKDSTLVTMTQNKPAEEVQQYEKDMDLSFFCSCLHPPDVVSFKIDRTAKSCKTPRRNEQMAKAEAFYEQWDSFGYFLCEPFVRIRGLKVVAYNKSQVETLKKLISERSFLPSVPLLDKSLEGNDKGVTFSNKDYDGFIAEFVRQINETLDGLDETVKAVLDYEEPKGPQLGFEDLKFLALILLCENVAAMTRFTADAVEEAIRNQIIEAIGEECTPEMFTEYMVFHDTKMYKKAFAPKPFSYEVRRPGHAPDGSVSLALNQGTTHKLLYTSCRSRKAELPADGTEDGVGAMRFSLNAAVDVRMYGQQNLHGVMLYNFAGTRLNVELTARARQFSSFILMIGSVSSSTRFEPKHSIVVRNKDDVIIPLLAKVIPSAQEFRDAIESLSPTQKRFAKAFREMQLQSTILGVVLMPIRPLLERVLNMPAGSLTKEIKLSQNLMDLFIEYQIPSDLLNYSGPASASMEEKVERVKQHTKAVTEMIREAKEEEKKQREEERQVAVDTFVRDAAQEQSATTQQFGMHRLTGGASRPKTRQYREGFPVRAARRMEAGTGLFGANSARGDGSFDAVVFSSSAQRTPSAMPCSAAPPPAPSGSVELNDVFATPLDGSAQQPKVAAEESRGEGEAEASKGARDEWQEVDQDEELVPKDALSFTQIPKRLDGVFEKMEAGSKVRPVTLKPLEKGWTLKRKAGLIAKPVSTWTSKQELKEEHAKTLDLLDALSRSGELPLTDTTLHVIIPVAHCFEETVMNTVVQENVNPMEVIERTYLAMCETIHDMDASKLLKPAELERLDTAKQDRLTDMQD